MTTTNNPHPCTRATTIGSVSASNLTQSEVDCIRHNWSHMGCTHWFNDYGTEFWKTPEGITLEFYEW